MNRFAFLAACALGACFSPTFNNPQCGPAGECPLGFTCEQGVCRSDDAPIDGPRDGATDAPDLDAETDADTDGMEVEIDAPPKPTCPTGSTPSPNDPSRCFFVTGTFDSWDTVRNDCLAQGGDLADVLTPEENQVITDIATRAVWVGGTDEPSEGNWMWSVNGAPVDSGFTSWDSGQPNDPFFHMYNCMLTVFGAWHDEPCGDAYPGVCRVPAI